MSKKGSMFEREVCRDLSLWASGGKTDDDDIFWRTHGSGARATVRLRAGKTLEGQYGDVGYMRPEGKSFIDGWVVSLKSGYSRKSRSQKKEMQKLYGLDPLDLLDASAKRKHALVEFWEEIDKLAVQINKIPMLIFRRLRRDKIIVLYKTDMDRLNTRLGLDESRHCNPLSENIVLQYKHNQTKYSLFMAPLRQFLGWVPYRVACEYGAVHHICGAKNLDDK